VGTRFEEVEVGQAIPELRKEPSTQNLVKFAGATGDFYQIHYDREFAEKAGLPDVIVHGFLKKAYMAEAATAWAGGAGTLRKLVAQYRGIDLVSRPSTPQSFTVRGTVKRKWEEGGERLVELELEGVDTQGKVTTPGSAIVALPA
jgi:acyl dehydratase